MSTTNKLINNIKISTTIIIDYLKGLSIYASNQIDTLWELAHEGSVEDLALPENKEALLSGEEFIKEIQTIISSNNEKITKNLEDLESEISRIRTIGNYYIDKLQLPLVDKIIERGKLYGVTIEPFFLHNVPENAKQFFKDGELEYELARLNDLYSYGRFS